MLAGAAVVAWNVNLPLIAYSPGPVAGATDGVVVDGTDTYSSEGELIMLTVAGQDVNIFEVFLAFLDPTVDLLPRELVRDPDETDEQFRRRTLEMMDQSTATAVGVALEHLDVTDQPSHLFVMGYAADTPAGQVLEIGDRLEEVEGRPIAEAADLLSTLEELEPGDVVSMAVERDGEALVFDVELAESTEEPGGAFLGIFVRPLPFWVDIDAGIVGGPSAGMMYTLAIIDVLTPDGLTQGRVVAGTGTVDPEGNVGPIGGVRQKVVAAEAAGAELMLVPMANLAAAETAPRDDLDLVGVATIEDALEALGGVETRS